MKLKRLILIVRETRLEELTRRFNTVEQAKFYIEHLNEDFSDYLNEHESYKSILGSINDFLEKHGRVVVLDRGFISRFVFEPDDIIYVVGQDGLVANTLKYIDNQPVAGINPDPRRYTGALLPFNIDNIGLLEPHKMVDKLIVKPVTLGKATLKDGQVLYAVNDFFIGQQTHVSSRYEIRYGGKIEKQSSSGIIVSTGMGSTGWLKSIVSSASRVTRGASQSDSTPIMDELNMPWDSNDLIFSVREAYASSITGNDLVFGRVNKNRPLEIASFMTDRGVIFSDGIEDDYLSFNAGMVASITVAEKRGHLVLPEYN